MWKPIVGFVAFAGLALWILAKAGGDVDLGGEKHEAVPHSAEAVASAPSK